MTTFDPPAAAAALLELRRARQQTHGLPAAVAPRSEADGAAVQLALARLLGAMPPAGFKIGATGKRMQAYLGLSGPAAGFMAAAGLHASGATLRFADFLSPGVECEVAVRLARDLPPGPCSPAQAEAAVGELMAGIEIVENRYHDLVAVGVPTMIADQVFHAAAVLGAPGPDWRSLDIPALAGRMSIDGEVREQRRSLRPARASDELPGLAGGVGGRRCVRWFEGGAGDHAGERDATDLARSPGARHRRVRAVAPGDGNVGLTAPGESPLGSKLIVIASAKTA